MKRILTIIAAVLCLSCTKDLEIGRESIDGRFVCASIRSIEDNRTSLSGATMTWSEGDVLKVINHDQWLAKKHKSHQYVLTEGYAGKTTGIFELKSGESPAEGSTPKFYGMCTKNFYTFAGGDSKTATDLKLVYSVPQTQTFVNNGIADGVLPLYLFGSSLSSMGAYYCCGIIRLNLYSSKGVKVEISTIELAAQNAVSGQFYADCYNSPEAPCAGAYGSNYSNVILNANNKEIGDTEETATGFNIVVPAYSIGTFTVTVTSSTGDKLVLKKKSVMDVESGTIYNMTATKFGPEADSHVLVSIDGGIPVPINKLPPTVVPAESVVVTASDDTALTEDELNAVNAVAARAASASSVSLDLSKIKVPGDAFKLWFKNNSKIGELILPESVKSLPASLVTSYVKSLVLPTEIETIANSALNGYCHEIMIPQFVKKIEVGNQYTVTGFSVVPNSQYFSAEDGVLFDASGKTLVYYPAYRSAKSYVIPDGVTTVESHAFQYAKNLEELTVPASVTMMKTPFSQCKALKSITLLGGLDAKGEVVTKLTGITYNDDNSSLYPPFNGTIYCPNGTLNEYLTLSEWGRFRWLLNWRFVDDNVTILDGTSANIGTLTETDSEISWK